MVLGLRSKNRKGRLLQIDYLIHLQEINPWPPSQHLKSVETLLLVWENGDQSSGSFTCNVGDGKIEISDSFRLPVTLSRKGTDNFQKNYLEFSLYEPRKDKPAKSQLLGSAVINLADYGVINDAVAVSALINLKKSSKGSLQSVLYVNIQPFESLDKDESESVSEVTNEGNDDETEIASFTDDDVDDDVSTHSSRTTSSFAVESSKGSPSQDEKNVAKPANGEIRKLNGEPILPSAITGSNPEVRPTNETPKQLNGASRPPSSTSLLSTLQNPVNDISSKVVIPDGSIQMVKNSNQVESGASQISLEAGRKGWKDEKSGSEVIATSNLHVPRAEDKLRRVCDDDSNPEEFTVDKTNTSGEEIVDKLPQELSGRQAKLRSNTFAVDRASNGAQGNTRRDKLKHLKSVQLQFDVDETDVPINNIQIMKKVKKIGGPENVHRGGLSDRKETTNNQSDKRVQPKSEIEILEEELTKNAPADEADHHSASAKCENIKNKPQLKEKAKGINPSGDSHKAGASSAPGKREQQKSTFSPKNAELKSKVEMLEEELIEAAAVEAGLYSVVAEHGSSTNKVHTSARRLSRFYLHACKASSLAKRANASRAIISGLVLVSKACGNDVPRLTFWLSNSIVLRAIVSQVVKKSQNSEGSINGQVGKSKSYGQKDNKTNKSKHCDEWEDAWTFTSTLERVEAWIFSRIVESIWWQTLTPHMQSTAVRGSGSKKSHAKRYGLGDQDQGNFAIDLWKKAFKDACERLCPVRAEGHECGCLPILSRLVMEQLVHRLDVAMFNAILRESVEEMPTDPVSDPISDPKVLPIPAGNSSFGAGAQLKNAVGSWSRWLTDLFGIDDTDSADDNKPESETPFKVFHLLRALSDLMMLPFDMLAEKSTRKEVCPEFGVQIIERVLYNFVPDEFNPDTIPDAVFESLDSEDPAEDEKKSITSLPCIASPTIYSPPSSAPLTNIIGEVENQTLQRSGSTLLKKSYTSDDELDELDSPLTSIIIDKSKASPSTVSNWMPPGNNGRKVIRYQLLQQIWKEGE